MKNIDPRHYDGIVAPVVTEKAWGASEHNTVVFRVAAVRQDIEVLAPELAAVVVDPALQEVVVLVDHGHRPGRLL